MFEKDVQSLIEKKIKPFEQRVRNLEKQRSEPGIRAVMGGFGLIAGIFAFIYLIKKKYAL